MGNNYLYFPVNGIHALWLHSRLSLRPCALRRDLLLKVATSQQQNLGVFSPDDLSAGDPVVETLGGGVGSVNGDGFPNGGADEKVFAENAYLLGVKRKDDDTEQSFGIEESLKELCQLADVAVLAVVGSTYQIGTLGFPSFSSGVHLKGCYFAAIAISLHVSLSYLSFLYSGRLSRPNPRKYIGSGKVADIKSAIHALDVETVVYDDELSPGVDNYEIWRRPLVVM
ncbi:hypothetical protein MLD38_002107 [Melastoma candidum]|uniref:Uncharacterized protein n=1 Tax=Melastoma candidum TaxID=119954 RepID=A0ACB9SER6_9MYRT|nr:hypothetical protein MLD38_002107 [Melastoma candidum]